ncbi:MAG: cupin domain-containing protein [Phycisphaerae bacterium]|nr:cupin domain-containing protein [Phycisphaerae bacterium]
MTAADYPPIPNMASAQIDLEVGGMRGLHWHDTASELGYVVQGRAILTVVDAANNREITALNEGDIYSVPVGFAHSLACLGSEPCRVVAVYDDGRTVESNAFNVTDWLKAEPANILTAILNVPGDRLQQSAGTIPLITKNEPLLAVPAAPHGFATSAPQSFRFPLAEMTPVASSGGTFVQASKLDFPMSQTMIAALTVLFPRGIREPHWHPNADEWDYVLSGRAKITIFAGAGKSAVVEVGPGDLGYLPRNAAHAVETIGDEPFRLLSIFNADSFQAIGVSGLLIGTPNELLARNLGLTATEVSRITKEKKFITGA